MAKQRTGARQRANGGASAAEPDWPATRPELWHLDRITPYEANPRVHSNEQIAALAADMLADGVTMPILVDEAGVIIAGHGRLLAARANAFASYPVVVARGWTDEQKRSARIRDNQRTLMSSWDAELLKSEIGELKLAGYDIPLLGFPEAQLRAFGVAIGTEGQSDPDAAPEPPKNPVSRRGDLWLLGDHRILCGDATSESDVAVCRGAARPNLMVTDPPYGVNYNPKWRDDLGLDWTGQAQRRSTHPDAKPLKSRSLGKVSNDHEADWTPAWKLFAGDIAYVWHGGLHAGTVQVNLADSGFAVRAQIIWVKQHFVFSRGDYHWQHEPCWYAVRKKGNWQGDRKQTTIWSIANASAFRGEKDDMVTGHGTQKPVECMKRPIENNSKAGDAVYEPFSGSGTTIIAAEMTKRRCLAIEIDPAYVDVAVLRWQQFTGRKATLESSGKTFDDVKAERGKKRGRAPSVRPSRSGDGVRRAGLAPAADA